MKMYNFNCCPMCGYNEPLIWQNTDQLFDDGDCDDDALVHHYRCPRCGCDIDVTEPVKEDKETTFKEFWSEKETAD